MTAKSDGVLTLNISDYLDFPMKLAVIAPTEILLVFDKSLKLQRYLEILKYIQQYIIDNPATQLSLEDPEGYLNKCTQ